MKLIPTPKRVESSIDTQNLSEMNVSCVFISPVIATAPTLLTVIQSLFAQVPIQVLSNEPNLIGESEEQTLSVYIPLDAKNVVVDEAKLLSHNHCGQILGRSFHSDPPFDRYRILKDGEGICVSSSSEDGLFYGLQTLKQLLSNDAVPTHVLIDDWPDQLIRGIHLDLKGLMPRFEYMTQLVETLASYKINTIVLEYENKLPWPEHPLLEDPHHWSYEKLQSFTRHCTENHIQIIPLQQTFGHLHYILKFEKYRHLRETPDYPSEICPVNTAAADLILNRLRQIIEFHPGSKYVHIGCDETLYLNTCQSCQDRFGANGKFDNYIQHVNRTAEMVVLCGKKPVIWDDMLRKMSDDEISRLHPNLTVMVWSYYHKDMIDLQLDIHLERYRRLGTPMLGAGCCFGADNHTANLPNFRVRQENLQGWGMRGREYPLVGLISTTWAKYSSIDAYCELLPVISYPALLSAAIFWNSESFEQKDVDDSILFHYWGIRSIEESFEFAQINHGHYETTLYGDPHWLHHLAGSATKHQAEAIFLGLMAKLNRLLTTSEHTFERLYLLVEPNVQPIEAELFKRYMESLDNQIRTFEEESIEPLSLFYTEDQAKKWIRSRLFNSKWMINTALQRWPEIFDGATINLPAL